MKRYTLAGDYPMKRGGQLRVPGDVVEMKEDEAARYVAAGRLVPIVADPAAAPKSEKLPAVAPTDPAERRAAIKGAAEALDPAVADNFMKDGRPKTEALTEALGWPVTAAERDEVAPKNT